MRQNLRTAGLLLCVASYSQVFGEAQGRHPAPPAMDSRAAALAAATGYQAWNQTPALYVIPQVDETILPPVAVGFTRLRSCFTVVLPRESWPRCTWTWTGPSDAYGRPTSWLQLDITLTPSGLAAMEYLLSSLTETAIPTEVLVERYRAAERPAVGSVAFLVERQDSSDVTVTFLRGNLVVGVRGHGLPGPTALSLATALDHQILRDEGVTPLQVRTESQRLLAR